MKKIIWFTMALLLLLTYSADAQIGLKLKKDENTEEKEEGDESGSFADKMKAKAKNFNPMKAVGKLAGNLLTATTDDLGEVSMRIMYSENLYPSDAGTTETEYYGFWEEGTSIAGISFTKREGVGMFKIDGTVTIDGSVTEHVANGFYGGITEPTAGNHSFTVETVTGDKATFTAEPVEAIEIVSINGIPKGEPVTVSIDEDLVLELNNPDGGTADFYVSVLGEVFGVKTFNDIGYFKSTDKIVIPKEAYFHTSYPGLKYIQGDNYLQVTRVKDKLVPAPGVGAAQVISMSSDWVKINFQGEGETLLGVGYDKNNPRISNKYKEDGFVSDMSKLNAFMSPPLSQPKKIAIASFVVRATKLQQQQTSSSSSTVGNVTTTTTTTTTKTFPELPDSFWDALVADAYEKFKAEMQSTFNVEIIDIEKTIAAQAYDNMFSVDDTVAVSEVIKPYKDCKLLVPTTMGEILTAASSTFPADFPEVKLVNELGVDAILSVTLDCAMAWEDGALSPRLSFKMSGGTNGWKNGPMIYAQGYVQGPGQGLSETYSDDKDMITQMNEIMNLDKVMQHLGETLNDMKAAEANKGYERIWALK